MPAAIVFAGFLVGYFAYYMPYKERIECARLESLYGDAFRRYALAVPALAPRIHAYRPLGAEATASPPWTAARFAAAGEDEHVGIRGAAAVQHAHPGTAEVGRAQASAQRPAMSSGSTVTEL